ncbi:MAG: diaminopimelate epimerase [Bdellovibrionales bacterium]|nr:diaminopimelate epimerase [Bdellovibrionales bacterium]
MRFHKMQACGNDFVIVDHRSGIPSGFAFTSRLAAKVCDRHFGVGCDQILWLKPGSGETAATVAILNADGSTAEMCGNGMRAIGLHLARRGENPGKKRYSVRVESGSGSSVLVEIDLAGKFPEVALGVPLVKNLEESIVAPGLDRFGKFARVEVGNPHAVFFLPDPALDAIDLARDGAAIERDPLFPNRTNVEFAAVLDRRTIRVRVWERGAGATLACGSGACAVAAAAEARGLVDAGERIEIRLPGGSVFVRLEAGWRDGRGRALLSGPAEDVFSGEWADSGSSS